MEFLIASCLSWGVNYMMYCYAFIHDFILVIRKTLDNFGTLQSRISNLECHMASIVSKQISVELVAACSRSLPLS